MKILLINTPTSPTELHPEKLVKKNWFWEILIGENGIVSGKNPVTGRQPPFGIMFLSSVLKQKGHEVYVRDGFFTKKQDIFNFLEKHDIDLMGVSCVSYNWKRAKCIIEDVKKKYPKIVTVVGGAHPNAVEESCLEESIYIDVVIYGDGEYTILELLDRLEGGNSLEGLQGSHVRENKKIIKNPPRPFLKNLDELPFLDRDCIDIQKYQPSALFYKKTPWTAIFGSRGCPYSCVFCHSYRRVRSRSPNNVVDEMEYVIKKYGVKDISFYDETFVLKKKWVIELCNEILKRNLKVVWSVNARVNCVDEQILRLMKKAGCWRLLWGIESGVQKNLDKMKKATKIEDITKAIRITKKVGLESYGMFMFGILGETYEEAMQTIDFACNLGLDYVAFGTIDPLPGTEFYEEVKNTTGFLGLDRLTFGDISYVSPQMTEEKLKKLVEIGFKRFYLRPGYILWRLTKLRSWEDIKRHFRGFLLMISGG